MELRISFETLIVLERSVLQAFSNRIHIIWNFFNLGGAGNRRVSSTHSQYSRVCVYVCSHAGLVPAVWPSLNFWSSCVHPQNPGTIGLGHHTWFYVVLGTEPRALWKAKQALYNWATFPVLLGVFLYFPAETTFLALRSVLGYVLDPWVWAENSIRLKIISNLRVGSPQFRWWSYIGFSQNKLAIHIKMALHSKLLEGPADLLHPPWIHKIQLSFVNYFPKSFGIESAAPFHLNYWSREYDT